MTVDYKQQAVDKGLLPVPEESQDLFESIVEGGSGQPFAKVPVQARIAYWLAFLYAVGAISYIVSTP